MNKEKTTFEKAFTEAVDEGLLMLGESGREVVYFRLRHSHALSKEDLPSHQEIFVECLRDIFGSGAKAIEKTIIKSLCRKLGLAYVEKENFEFSECLNEIKMRWRKAENTR
ncbi:MAG: hypothetical protein NZ932_06125 [Candidatus Bathyarchaeota archaeon]|nr:hypothetical protein [Candidatus Bathyarchaeota archaeon]MDW8040881.1 hypothetical protein [Nitrososphaerota archaeon]